MLAATPKPFAQRTRFDWRLRTRSLALGARTRIMAILNVTPDSFSGDGLLAREGSSANALLPPSIARAANTKFAIAMAVQAIDAGADIVDIGAESTRPNATPLDPHDEQDRLLPVLEGILTLRPHAIISVDTHHAETARAAARAGAEIVNDVSGLHWDDSMPETVAATGCGLVLMHSRGRPSEWPHLPDLPHMAVLPTVYQGLSDGLQIAEAAHIAPNRIVLDPGFGFGKRGLENITLLEGLGQLHPLGRPLLVGISRKRFLGDLVAPLQANQHPSIAEARRSASIAANVAAILSGTHILRVHDVQSTREAAAVADALLKQTLDGRR
jgi:dihydropteroate synthase